MDFITKLFCISNNETLQNLQNMQNLKIICKYCNAMFKIYYIL